MSQEDNTHIFIQNCIAKALNNCHTPNLDDNNEEISLGSNTHTLDDQTDSLVDYQSVLADLSSSESLSNPMYGIEEPSRIVTLSMGYAKYMKRK